jgi:hypothetical protein
MRDEKTASTCLKEDPVFKVVNIWILHESEAFICKEELINIIK